MLLALPPFSLLCQCSSWKRNISCSTKYYQNIVGQKYIWVSVFSWVFSYWTNVGIALSSRITPHYFICSCQDTNKEKNFCSIYWRNRCIAHLLCSLHRRKQQWSSYCNPICYLKHNSGRLNKLSFIPLISLTSESDLYRFILSQLLKRLATHLPP